MKYNRRKILSNKAFHAIWTMASKVESYEELKANLIADKKACPKTLEKNYGITYDETLFIYKEIFDCYNTSFAKIMELASVSNSDIRDIFNIPIRSIEEWKSGRNKCPDYIRLMLLRFFHLISLGKYIYSEDYAMYMNTIPKVYKDTKSRKRNSNKSNKEYLGETERQPNEDYLDDIDRRMRAIEESQRAREEIYRISQQMKNQPSSKIVNETDYMDQIIHRNKK